MQTESNGRRKNQMVETESNQMVETKSNQMVETKSNQNQMVET